MENEIVFVTEESSDGGWTAKALGHSIFTEADTEIELKNNIKEAVQCHFDEKDVPTIIRLHFVKDEYIKV
ncbi:MAG: hypothetical protein HGGPFJEG_01561 [Ignavibacteria bacterium]|nr:hypothetical protein [Ignavibacteria bacterium]